MISPIKAHVDAHVRQGSAGTNYGDAAYVVLSATGADVQRGFLFFARPFPIGATIVSAVLRIYLRSGWDAGGPHTITVRRTIAAWKERGVGGVNYTNQPAVDGAASVTEVVANSPSGTLVEIDITTLMQTIAAGGAAYGLRLTVDTTGVKTFHSRSAADTTLRWGGEIVWVTAPSAPTDLRPSGGRSVSLAQPVMRWTPMDSDGDHQAEYQIQISENADMSTPGHDPGYVASDFSEHDLATTAFSLDDDTGYYWRVRVKDDGGRESPWSDIQSFRRDTKGVLTITDPPASPGNTVEETTPPIVHTFATRTQESVEYVLTEQGDGESVEREIYDSGRSITTDLSFTLPSGLINDPAATYRIYDRVYDDIDREETPGDPAYVEAVREFTYVRSGTPAAVETLEVTDGATATDAPGVVLDWTRAATPDYFALRVDDVYVATRIDPADVLVAGDEYRMVIYDLQPDVEHSIEIEAVVLDGGVFTHSDNNPVVEFTPEPQAIWLVAEDAGISVALLGTSDQAMDLGEESAVHAPPGRRAPLRIRDSLRGYEGTLSGTLEPYLDLSAIEWRDRLLALKELPLDASIRLVMRGYSFPVQLGPFKITALSVDELEFAAEVPFEQTDEFTVRAL